MIGLRERTGNRTTPSTKANVSDMGFFADPAALTSISDRHGLIDEMRNGRNSLRQRFIQSLNRKRSFPAWQPAQSVEYGTTRDDNQEKQTSLIRKSISSLSSSLRDSFSLDSSAEDENRPSVIRKSFGSMSSSLRGLRTSLGSRPSQDQENDSEKLPYCDFSRSIGYASGISGRSNRRGFGRSSNASSGDNSIPQLPGLDEMIAKARAERLSSDDQSPNSLFSMSIFDGLDRPIATDYPDKEYTEPATEQPPPILGRFPIRLKCPNPTLSKRIARSKAEQRIQPRVPSDDSGYSSGSDKTKDNASNTPGTSKVPVTWLDSILEMTVATRDGVRQVRIPTETEEERYTRLSKKVYVFVPDETDHAKPWPKKTYPDLKTALVAICTRYKPFYAPFAAYTNLTRTVQLFPADFKLPRNTSVIPGSIMFTMQEALDNWESTLFCRSLSVVEEETEDQGTIEMTFDTGAEFGSEGTCEISPPPSYNISNHESDETLDYSMLEPSPESSILIETNPLKNPNQLMEDSQTSWTDQSMSTEDYDMTIASRMGFIG
ncbi:uncharacterized protein F4807DRAFT_471587 [Annulohypoxylon truncatum]|uniref:uncharacterized protein n=1 Tax=Annulohypoxylon truncatum TaxID=327061 RepID=UPI002007D0C5|nr:uncharacterized protein F4807DRAFT_471587 [Annulohypoxylon truncatum]KAI1213110.1 hypothetical protein F4807DRAFT_471587 [Annulohypoxylon truncatum]